MDEPHRIVVAGGGVAGLEIATSFGRRWRRARRRGGNAPTVTLLDREPAHVWKPMLHTIAAGTRDIAQQQTTYLAQARDAGFAFVPGALAGLDRRAREVIVAPLHAPDGRLLLPERRLGYDTLILALGSEANDFGTPGVREHCLKIDSRSQADAVNLEIRIRMLQCLAQDRPLRIAIVGGGATGVELAAELVQLGEAAAAYGGRGASLEVALIEAGPRLLPGFPEDISAATLRRLEGLGIAVTVGNGVVAAEPEGFRMADGGRVPASLKIWAAGVKAGGVLAELDGLEAARDNRLVVRPSLQTGRDPRIFALGDCAAFTPPGAGRPLAPTAQVAHQQAKHLIRHLPRTIARGDPVPGFVYRDFGALVSLADYDAFGSLGRFGLFRGVTYRGRLAQISHILLYRAHQARLFGFWRGSLLWLVDRLNVRLRPPIRLD